jgi:hypothetical protein
LFAASILARRKRADELQFVWSGDKLSVPGGSRILFNSRTWLLGLGRNARPRGKFLRHRDTRGHRKKGTNSNLKSSHELPSVHSIITSLLALDEVKVSFVRSMLSDHAWQNVRSPRLSARFCHP